MEQGDTKVVTLPSGKRITVLKDSTPEEIKDLALRNNLATEADYERETQTIADWLPLIGEVSLGTAGAIYGAGVGSVIPVAGTAVGAIALGAAGTFGGSLLGQAAEDVAEGRSVSLDYERAGKAATEDALFSLAGGAIFRGIGKIWSKVNNIPTATLPTGAAKFTDTELAKAESLNKRLAETEGVGLLPSQTPAATKAMKLGEEYQRASRASGNVVEETLEVQRKYVSEQLQGLLAQTKGKSREETGLAVQRLLGDVEEASKAQFKTAFSQIDDLGGLNLRADDILLRAEDAARNTGMSLGVDTSLGRVRDVLKNLPEVITPRDLSIVKTQVQTVLSNGRLSGQAKAAAESALSTINRKLADPRVVKTGSVSQIGEEAMQRIVNNVGKTAISASERRVAKYLSEMPTHLNFAQARTYTSELKAMSRQLEKDTAPNSPALGTLKRAIAQMEKNLDEAGKAISKEDGNLYDFYRATNEGYKNTIDMLYSDSMKKVVTSNPEDAGSILYATGSTTPIQELRRVLDHAKEMNKTLPKNERIKTGVGKGVDLYESVKKGFLNEAFRPENINTLMKQMQTPKFRDTMKEVLNDPQQFKMFERVADDVKILSKGFDQVGEGGASLVVRGAEISAVRNAADAPLRTLVMAYLPAFFKGRLTHQEMAKHLAEVRKYSKALREGYDPKAARAAEDASMAYKGMLVGGVVGAPTSNERRGN